MGKARGPYLTKVKVDSCDKHYSLLLIIVLDFSLVHNKKQRRTMEKILLDTYAEKTIVLSCHRCLINTGVEKTVEWQLIEVATHRNDNSPNAHRDGNSPNAL